MGRFVYNNTLKPCEMGMPVFIPPTGGVFIGKWRGRSAPGESRSTQVVICCRKSARWNWTEPCTVSLGGVKAFGIVVRFGSSASAKSVPRVTNNASELQHIV